MSEIERFEKDVKSDQKLRDELKQKGLDAAKIVEFANAKGYKITKADVAAYAKAKKAKLSEEALAKVAAGDTTQTSTDVEQSGVEVTTYATTSEVEVETEVAAVAAVCLT
ncbi:MAG: Nif11-like leader peptide family RiPP precursor [Acidobacteriota bacterium]